MTETMEDFLRRLGEASPAPGGGSAAALCGAIAASLAGMVAGLAMGKQGYESVQLDCRDLALKAEALRRRFVELVTLDEDAFVDVSLAYKMPKTSDSERLKRKEAIQHALREATLVPLETMERAVEALQVAQGALQKGARSAFTDAGAASLIAQSCLRAASLNVAVNLASIEDSKFREESGARSKALLERGAAVARALDDEVEKRF